MNIDALIPPLLQPYKEWITLALLAIVFVIRPSLPVPKADSSGWYVFLFNVLDKIAGNFGNAAHTLDNLPATEKPVAVVPTAGASSAVTPPANQGA